VQTDASVTSLADTRSILSNARYVFLDQAKHTKHWIDELTMVCSLEHRLRHYDLVTAIEVLGSGTPQRVPSLLKVRIGRSAKRVSRHQLTDRIATRQDAMHSYKAYTDTEAIKIVENLDEAIRLRLACEELLPLPMMSYSISE
jgi:hypothetical protein